MPNIEGVNREVFPDPDASLLRASTRRIGWSVALLCAGMVVAGAALVFGALWWKSTFHTEQDPHGHYLYVAIDPLDLALAGAIIGAGAVILAGVAATFFARRATAPLQDALRRQRNFVADASHELRTPIAVLDARVQHVAALGRDDARLQPVLRELRSDTAHLSAIVDDLLQLATTTPLSGSADLADAVASVRAELEVLAREQGVAVEINNEIPGPSPLVTVPPVALRRVLLALVDNAVSHTPHGGRVRITTRLARPGRAEVRIADTGGGITGIDPDRIFERFAHGTSGRNQSHGIGLALVRDTVTRCGGSVELTANSPAGTEFTVVLPVSDSASNPTTKREPE